jgi:outer membrane protein OmpA-like peptidoglycan-associated protein/tetratricopeptide (TPR) repeat protein
MKFFKCITLITLTAFSTFAVFAQKQIEMGDIFYNDFQYKEAIKEYEAALIKERTFKNEAHLLTNLAYSYMYTFQYSKAEQAFLQLVKIGDKKPAPEVYLDYGNVLKILGNYEKAKEQFTYYATLVQKDEYARFLDRSLNWAIKNKELTRPNTLVLPTNLNVSGQSLGYCFFDEGVIYAQAKDTNFSEFTTLFDLRYAKIIDSTTFLAQNEYVNEIMFPYNEGSPSVSADEQTLYFTATSARIKDGQVKSGNGQVSTEGVSNLRIYTAQLENGVFMNVTELPFNNKDYNFIQPFISADDHTLYFVSDMPGGYGGLDIYKCNKLADGKWSSPINLGDKVNTSEQECFPYLVNKDFYFASKGHVGFGGYDIFKTTIGANATIGNAQNIGKPYNSSKDDMAYVLAKDGISGYFSSNRDNDDGFDKVYYFNDNYTPSTKRVDVVATVKSTVQDTAAKANIATAAKVKSAITVATTTKTPKPTPTPATKSTPKLPPVANRIPSNQKAVVANKAIETAVKSATEAARIGETKTVYFEFNSSTLQQDLTALNTIVAAWKLNTKLQIEVVAYTDCRGSAAYNQKLANKRAQSVVNYMVKLGVNQKQIIAIGIGENQALDNCETCTLCTEAQHAANRKVEMKVHE